MSVPAELLERAAVAAARAQWDANRARERERPVKMYLGDRELSPLGSWDELDPEVQERFVASMRGPVAAALEVARGG